jgi:Flp pilus assembly protein TadD
MRYVCPRWWLLVAAVVLSACSTEPRAPRAALLASKGQEEQAIVELLEYLEAHPGALEERRLLIRLYGAVGRIDLAEKQAERLAADLPETSPIPWLELGHAYELTHKYELALVFYDRAAAAAPQDPVGPRTGGLRAARWGEVELAVPRLTEALRRESRDAEAWHALGLCKSRLGDVKGARNAYRSALRVDPAALENHLGLATLALKIGDFQGAVEHYEALIRARPNYAAAYLGKAWALIRLGRLSDAEAAILSSERNGGDRAVARAQRQLIAELREQDRSPKPATESQTQP